MGFITQRGVRQSFYEVILPYFQALRPRQWTKNLVVFAAPLFAFSLNWQSSSGMCLAFVLFCCASSSFYLINDIADVETDRRHPIKCKRPIAAGAVSIPVALCMAIVLLGGALTIGWMYASRLGLVLLGYALLQVAYNLKLKHTALLDIVAIAMGFVLRACAGGAATGIALSPWFLLCTAMLALFLGIEKRKAELRLTKGQGRKTRAVLRRYSLSLLTRMESTVTTGTVMSYALWSSGPVVNGASTSWMLLTLPFVLYGVFRYQLLSDPKPISRKVLGGECGSSTERPEEILLKDFPILVTTIAWGVTSFAILFLQHQGKL
jgi:decaprenyl-phosphate phosphoribosyltransferase